MKEQALAVAKQATNPNDKMNALREYLQAFVLRSLHESEAFGCLSFVRGTALRFLYNLPRFSEDLDFSLEEKTNYNPEKWLAKLKRDLEFARFDASVNWNEKTTVHSGWVRIAGLLKEAGLSGQSGQKISIKIEVDTRPPKGAVLETQVINKYFLFALRHYDLSSLMAGKIHALCTRNYLKGRDYYDLLWYRTQRPPVEPNLLLLQNALTQTMSKPWPAKNWRDYLIEKINSVDWKQLIKDVSPFLERPEDQALLKPEFFLKAIS